MTTLLSFCLNFQSVHTSQLSVAGEEDMPDQYPSSTQVGAPTVHKVEGPQPAGQQCGRHREVTKAGEESQQSH